VTASATARTTIKPPSDAAVRHTALDTTRSFLVQAPAGSGKTELLTDRLLALLTQVEKPEQILAITFTRKAASEMHARVMHKLAAGHQPAPDAHSAPHAHKSWQLAQQVLQRNDALGWHLLEHPARLSICTIDALCARLVSAMPWLSALGGMTAVADDEALHYQAAVRATLHMADEEPAVARLLAHLDVDMNATSQLLVRMLACRDQWLPLLHGHDTQALVDALDWAITTDLQVLPELMPPGWAQDLAAALQHAAQVLAGTGQSHLTALLDWDGQPLPARADALPAWQAVAHALLTQKNTLRKSLTKKEGFDPKSPFKPVLLQWLQAHDDDEPWVAALAAIRTLPGQGYLPAQLAVLHDLVRVLHLTAAQLALQFSSAGELDFIEITQRALQALGDTHSPTDLLLSLDNTIAHILVDEFQDTSFTQISLLERLTAGWTAGDGRTLFLVGDPMQSIYRFRKAEVGWFLRVKQYGLGQVKITPLVLTDNFRSQAGIVDWVNQTFAPLFPARDQPQLGGIRYAPSTAFHPAQHDGVHLHPVFMLPDAETGQADTGQQQTETAVLACVKQALQRHAHATHPVAILVRARRHLGQVVRLLSRHGISCQAVDLEPLDQRQSVQDMLQLIRALSHPADRLAWLSVLRSPLCGLRLHSLHALFGDDAQHSMRTVPEQMRRWLNDRTNSHAALDADETRRLVHAATALLDNGNASGRLPFAAWVQQVWQRLGGDRIYASAHDHADVEQLLRLLETVLPYGVNAAAEDAIDMDVLAQRVKQLYAAPEAATPAVQVMTIHKSKGLQFETVILMGLHHASRPDPAPLLAFEQIEGRLLMGPIAPRTSTTPDAVSHYLAQREKQRAAFEMDRLLYVATTRARQCLHLMFELELDADAQADSFIKPPPASSLLGHLWPVIDTQRLQQQAVQVLAANAAQPAATHAIEGEKAGDQTRKLWRMTLDSLPAPLSGTPPESAPAPASFASSWQWQSTNQQDDSLTGTVAHAWLERIGREGLSVWPESRLRASLPTIARQLGRAGMAIEQVHAASQVVLDTLLATLHSSRGRWLLQASQACREWSLLDASGRVSVIDLTISDKTGWLVVDYKTGVPQAHEAIEHFSQRMRQRYAEQIAHYCAQVTALDGRPAQGALYFPRADIWLPV